MEYCDSRRIKEIRDNTAKMADAFTRIADALERLADRKTENSSEKPNNCEDLQDWKDRMWAEAVIEPQKHCHRPNNVACHPEQGDMWCRGCDYWYANEPRTKRDGER